ncbi:MAG: DUF4293 domain-containing protein [Bacteroidota bacterium]
MIQRIQTLFLLLAIAATGSIFFLPLVSYYGLEHILMLDITKITNPVPGDVIPGLDKISVLPLFIAYILVIVIALVAIFLYKNRPIQYRVVAVAMLVNILLVAGIFYYADKIGKMINVAPAYGAGVYLAIVPLIFFVLAQRYIRRDEKLVRSADRLR